MAKTDDIWATFAAETGLPFNEIKGQGRAVREMGLFPKFHRHDKAQHVPDMALAHLTVAVMLRSPVIATPAGIQRIGDAEVDEESRRDLAEAADDLRHIGLDAMLRPDHTFTEALAAVYGLARRDPERFDLEWTPLSWVMVERRTSAGEIYLHRQPITGGREFIMWNHYAPARPHGGGSLEDIGRLRASVIAAVARVADRVQT